jgi:hypothetical protein
MNMLTPKAQRQMEARFQAEREALEIFDLVVAEWKSDPMSVQCFDLRLVERAKLVAATLKANPRIF